MAPLDSSNKALNAVARAMGWMTSVATMVVLGFIINRWPEKGGPIAAGIVGVAIALLNDSWQMVSIADRVMGFPPLPPGRAMLHDMFSMAICMGGVVLIIFAGYAVKDEERSDSLQMSLYSVDPYDSFDPKSMLMAGQWFLVAVVAWRLIFSIWGCRECVKHGPQYRARRQQHLQQRRRRMASDVGMAESGHGNLRPNMGRTFA